MSLPLCLAPWLGGLRHLLPHLWSNLALLQSCSTSRPLCVPRCPLPPSPTGSQVRPSQLIALLKQVDHKPFANNSPAPGCRVECDHRQSHESHDKGNQNTKGNKTHPEHKVPMTGTPRESRHVLLLPAPVCAAQEAGDCQGHQELLGTQPAVQCGQGRGHI